MRRKRARVQGAERAVALPRTCRAAALLDVARRDIASSWLLPAMTIAV